MRRLFLTLCTIVLASGLCAAADISTYHAYVASDLCSRLLLGPNTAVRQECSPRAYAALKDGASAVLVRSNDNTVLDINKEKVVRDSTSGFGKTVPAEALALRLFDLRTYKAKGAGIFETIRRALATMSPQPVRFRLVHDGRKRPHSEWTQWRGIRIERVTRVDAY